MLHYEKGSEVTLRASLKVLFWFLKRYPVC